MADRALLLFAKPAVADRVKTRLIGRLTGGQAADLQAAFQADLLSTLGGIADGDLIVYWAVEPDEPIPEIPAGGRRQVGADLGERLRAAFEEIGASHRYAVVVGSDHPDLPLERIAEAFAALRDGADVVLGPASDGGYYLIGGAARAMAAELFEGIPWSTSGVFATTVERARELGLRVEELALGDDVDTWADLERFVERLRRGPAHLCPRSRAVLAALGWETEAACAS